MGLKKNTVYYVVSSLWLSLIALLIHYQNSGGEILGDYFNYLNAGIYSINLIVLCVSLVCVIYHLGANSTFFKYFSSLLQALIVLCGCLVLLNLWINAYFIENRMPGTPIMQVALFQKPDYCTYKYIFYKVAENGKIAYLCPNHYGLIPSIGHLALPPDFYGDTLDASYLSG